tara:strand:+ start:111 stop:395 length:285 start_codon:yes stop_codon:yes gene_type:complete
MKKKIWLVIERNNYGDDNDNYAISKTANTVEQATKFKIHLDALNDKKNRTYFIVSDINTVMDKVVYHHNKSVEEKPLILTDEVKEKDTSSEMPF